MPTSPEMSARAPYPLWTYFVRPLWLAIQATIWILAWRRIPLLRSGLLRAFGSRICGSVLIGSGVKIYFPWLLSIGAKSAIGERVNFYNLGGVEVGNRVVISQDVYFCGGTHDYSIANYPLVTRRIVVEDDVWIGAGAFIGPGVHIGAGSVIGARSVVVKDVVPWTVVAGNPARKIRQRTLKIL